MFIYIILAIIVAYFYFKSNKESFYQVDYECKSDKPECYRCQKNLGCVKGFYEGLYLDKCKKNCRDGIHKKEWYSKYLHFYPIGEKIEIDKQQKICPDYLLSNDCIIPSHNLLTTHKYL
jgi:hypothetical protein